MQRLSRELSRARTRTPAKEHRHHRGGGGGGGGGDGAQRRQGYGFGGHLSTPVMSRPPRLEREDAVNPHVKPQGFYQTRSGGSGAAPYGAHVMATHAPRMPPSPPTLPPDSKEHAKLSPLSRLRDLVSAPTPQNEEEHSSHGLIWTVVASSIEDVDWECWFASHTHTHTTCQGVGIFLVPGDGS